MGNTKQNNEGNPKKATHTHQQWKKAAPMAFSQIRQAMWLATARSFSQPKPDIATHKKIMPSKAKGFIPWDEYAKRVLPVYDTLRSRERLYTYGHDYDTTETDCGYYIKQGADTLGIKGFPSYVPDIVNNLIKYGDTTTNPKNIKPGMVMVFADSGYKYDARHPALRYAHAALATDVDTNAGIVNLLNSTVHNHKPGTIQPGHLSMKTGKRTDLGWNVEGSDFVLAGRLPLDANKAADAKGKPNPIHVHQAPVLPPAFTSEWAGAPMPGKISFLRSNEWMNEYNAGGNASTQMPSATPVAHPGASQNGKNSGGVSVNFHSMATHANSSHTELNNTAHNIYAEVVAVLTAAVADSKIGIDIC